MRRLRALAVTFAALALLLPAAARADGPAAPAGCVADAGATALGPGAAAGRDAIAVSPTAIGLGSAPRLQALLGAQFAGVWVDPTRDGWGVGLAPGPLDLATARELIVTAALGGTAHPAAASLSVVAQPWSYEELSGIETAVDRVMNAPGSPYFGAYGIACAPDGTMRLVVTIYDVTSAADEARLRLFLARYGDRVAVERVHGGELVVLGVAGSSGAQPPAGRARIAAAPRRAGVTVRVRIACPRSAARACAGRVSLRLTRRGAAARSAAPRVLLTCSFAKLAPGRERTLTVRLTPRQRTALADPRAGRLSAVVR